MPDPFRLYFLPVVPVPFSGLEVYTAKMNVDPFGIDTCRVMQYFVPQNRCVRWRG